MARRLQYSEEQMQKALAAVADGMKVFTTSKTFCVPKTTLLYKSTGVYPIERKIGPETVLPIEKETLLPLDVAVFRLLKASWKSVVHNWRIKHNGERLKREHFGLILNRALAIVDVEKVLPNGFRTCGLDPSTPDAIKYERIIKSQEQVVTVEKEQKNVDSVSEHLKFFEAQLNAETLISFQNSPDLWTGNLEDKNSFHFWQKLKLKVQSRNDTNHTPDTGTETVEIILNPGDDVDWNKIDEIFPNGVAAAIVVENVNNNYIENNETISSMINLSQTATEVLIQPEEAREESKPDCDIDATTAKKCVVPVDIPSPFKSSLFLPTPKLNISKPKLELPSVATSDSWRQYHQKKEAEKQLQEKEERKQKREEKEKKKEKLNQIEENAVNDSYLSDEEENSNLENENEDSVNINHTGIVEICQNDMKENSYVVVCYDNQYYPGIIVELDEDDVRVKTMVKSGSTGWKWPTPDDVIWYSRSDLMEIIEQPNFAAVNKSVVFHVPEMQKY
ncbi:hypothetical protein JTB14_020987 [Gonioctena quinquepunctata]|nr:hypothetical protein JTB14_020987 [Gonioctena quinquepunctata]